MNTERTGSAESVEPSEKLCPSAPATLGNAVLIGVRIGIGDGLQIVPTDRPIPVTQEIIDLAAPLEPDELFRFATTCAAGRCPHFAADKCQIAVGSMNRLDEVVTDLPRCAIRKQCRWFQQEGPAMCRRCPQIVRNQADPSPDMVAIVGGDSA